MNIIFRTDASLHIGTGHVMRCLTLADALAKQGVQCHFVCREHSGHLLSLIRERGHQVTALPKNTTHQANGLATDAPAHATWLGTDWQTDAEQTQATISDNTVDWLIVDHYALDTHWETTLRSNCQRLMVIDDLADRPHNCDLLLDQNLVADQQLRYDALIPTHCGRLLGPDYALLQPQYAELHPRTPPRLGPIQRILVFFSGADQHNLSRQTLTAFQALERPDLTLEMVLHPQHPQMKAIRAQSNGYNNIILHDKPLPSLAPLMLQADIAIGAGGATSWERCCLGLPSIVISLADNQQPIAAALQQQGFIHWIGHYDAVDSTRIQQALKECLTSRTLVTWSKQCMKLVDGKGLERVVAALMLNTTTPLRARRAELHDEKRLLTWANDPIVRRHAFHSQPITPETHRTWFYQLLRNPTHCQLFIIETTAGFPIGQVRFEQDKDNWYISYSLSDIARYRKLGTKSLQIAIATLEKYIRNARLLAKVKKTNIPSQKVFENLSFTANTKESEKTIIYSYTF